MYVTCELIVNQSQQKYIVKDCIGSDCWLVFVEIPCIRVADTGGDLDCRVVV